MPNLVSPDIVSWMMWLTRESTGNEMRDQYFNQPKRSPAFWVMVVLLIAVNVWFDYYHPIGIILDFIIGMVWFLRSSSSTTTGV